MESSKEIEERAAAWLAKRDSGDWAEEDERRLQQWLDASTANTVAYIRLEMVWNEALRLKALGAGTQRGVVPPPKAWCLSAFFGQRKSAATGEDAAVGSAPAITASAVSASRSFKRWRAMAASLILSVAAGIAWHLWFTGPDYSTPVGGVSSVPMQDGSTVTLNTDSAIRVAVTDKQRRVDLERGEAFFDVAKDPTRPFVVTAGSKRVIAVGTKFSVRRVGDDVRVFVSEGKVRLEDDSVPVVSDDAPGEAGAANAKLEKLAPEQPETLAMLLTAGTIARARDSGVLVQQKRLAEVEAYLTWRSGFVSFRETPLAEAVSEINRYNTHKIVIQDPQVAAIPISGKFRSTNFEAFVRLLEDGFSVRAQYTDDRIFLTRRNASVNGAITQK